MPNFLNRLGNTLNNPLLGMGLGIMQANQPRFAIGRIPQGPSGLGGALGVGFKNALQMQQLAQQRQQQAFRNRLLQEQAGIARSREQRERTKFDITRRSAASQMRSQEALQDYLRREGTSIFDLEARGLAFGAGYGEEIIKQQLKPSPKVDYETFKEGDEFVTYKIDPTTGERGDIVSRGPRYKSTTDIDVTFEQPSLTSPKGFGKAQLENIRESIGRKLDMVESATRTLSSLEEAGPYATGFSGSLLETVSGVLDAPYIRELDLKSMLPGDQEKIIKFRTEARSLAARLVPRVTGDISGRYTEQEQARAREAQQALKLSGSMENTVTAIKTFLDAERNAILTKDIPNIANSTGSDLATDIGRENVMRQMIKLGFSQNDSIKLMADYIEKIQGGYFR